MLLLHIPAVTIDSTGYNPNNFPKIPAAVEIVIILVKHNIINCQVRAWPKTFKLSKAIPMPVSTAGV